MIYLDNAATSGYKPVKVVNAVEYALKNLSANPGRSGHKASLDASMAVFSVRKKVNDMFSCENENCVCFTANCTHSINFVLKGVLSHGDHVIVSSLEHNAVMRPLNYLSMEAGISYDVAYADPYDQKETLENFEKLVKPNTKLIFTTHASNVTGTVMPIKEIGEFCESKGILFGVDAAQTAGVLPINMKTMHIDYLCVAPHKGLYAPMGTGILIANKPIRNITISGGTGTNSSQMIQPDDFPERVESGTSNVPGIVGIGAGMDFVKGRGIDKIYKHELNLTAFMYERLRKTGALLYTPAPKFGMSAPVLSFNLKDKNSVETSEALNRMGIAVRGGLHCAPSAHKQLGTKEVGTVRVSPGLMSSYQDAEKFIYAVKKIK